MRSSPGGSIVPTRMAGATPKEITSASESNSAPSRLSAFSDRASAPSMESRSTAATIISAANSGRPLTASAHAMKPTPALASVAAQGRCLANPIESLIELLFPDTGHTPSLTA
jgi:hypothetical protein